MRRLFSLLMLAMAIHCGAQHVSIADNEFQIDGEQVWFNGINTPWHNFNDFGNPSFNFDWWTSEFQKYAQNNINLARVWIHMSGEISPTIESDGYITGVPADFWTHMDHLFKIAKDNKVYIIPALFSFDITQDKYSTHEQWRLFIQNPHNVTSYINNVLKPMLERYRDEDYLLAWEICNEPEWMFENTEHGPQSQDDVQVFHAMIAAAIHENSSQLVTTGSAAPKWNSSVYKSWGGTAGNMYSDDALTGAIDDDNAYLDFYQFHWYAWQTSSMGSPFTKTTASYKVDDKPVLVGESEGNDVCDDNFCQTVTEMYENAYTNGFDGVCAWKTPQNDGHGTFENIAEATNAFYANHPELILNGPSTIDAGTEQTSALFSIHPNPAQNGHTLLQYSNLLDASLLTITNLNGATIRQIKLDKSGEVNVELNGINNGIYLVNISTSNNTLTQKLIIQ